MSEEVATLLSSLVGARHFEDAARLAVRSLVIRAGEALASSPYHRRGTLLRALVHVRPEDAYRRLLVVGSEVAHAPIEREAAGTAPEAGAAPTAGADVSFAASTTAWRSVVEHRQAVSIDVTMEGIEVHGPGPRGSQPKRFPAAFSSPDSRRRLLGRSATHVLALPLRAPGGAVAGMISLEAECMAAVGQAFIWGECAPALQLIADLAAPYLLQLPSRPGAGPPTDDLLPVIGAVMAGTIAVLQVFAQQNETVLLSGPTGAGKSRLARWCHEQSRRRGQPFVTLDLTTVPEDLQMGELFGWRKGAFTGAVRDNPGSVSRAEGGTLFIDEIDKLSLKAQSGLLRVLEEKTHRMLGEGIGERRSDVRFIIGTNVDLREAVQAGRFREDLYYRINVLPIRIPSLDERRDEIVPWATYMLQRRHREDAPDGHSSLSAEAQAILLDAAWPGSLRQLDNIIRRAYGLFMVEHPGIQQALVLEGKHVERALTYEGASSEWSLVESLCVAAVAFVREAQRRPRQFGLEHANAFPGFVLGTAVEQHGMDEAFRLLGCDNLLKGRNQYRTLKREMQRVEALCRAIGLKELPFADLFSEEEIP